MGRLAVTRLELTGAGMLKHSLNTTHLNIKDFHISALASRKWSFGFFDVALLLRPQSRSLWRSTVDHLAFRFVDKQLCAIKSFPKTHLNPQKRLQARSGVHRSDAAPLRTGCGERQVLTCEQADVHQRCEGAASTRLLLLQL